MARNRKSTVGTVRAGTVILALLVCSFLAAAGVGYVWHCNRNEALRVAIKKAGMERERLRKYAEVLDNRLNTVQSVDHLRTQVTNLNLGLLMPEMSQILTLHEPPVKAAARPSEVVRLAGRR